MEPPPWVVVQRLNQVLEMCLFPWEEWPFPLYVSIYWFDNYMQVQQANSWQGDIIFCDPLEGVVAIPQELLDQVLETMPKLVGMDDKVKEAVLQGSTVNDAFKKFRTKI